MISHKLVTDNFSHKLLSQYVIFLVVIDSSMLLDPVHVDSSNTNPTTLHSSSTIPLG